MIKLKNLPSVGQINLYDVLQVEHDQRHSHVGLFFASPHSAPCKHLAQLLGLL